MRVTCRTRADLSPCTCLRSSADMANAMRAAPSEASSVAKEVFSSVSRVDIRGFGQRRGLRKGRIVYKKMRQ